MMHWRWTHLWQAKRLPQVGHHRTPPRHGLSSINRDLAMSGVRGLNGIARFRQSVPQMCPQSAWRGARDRVSLACTWHNDGLRV